jgi:AcrR family transcriptional regulator
MDSREKLIEAARRCLLERGHAACSVKAIADMAGVNHGLVHHHFGSKEGLLVAVAEREAKRRRDLLLQAGSPAGLPSLIMDSLLPDREFFHLVIEFFAIARRMPRVGETVRSCLRQHRETLETVLNATDKSLASRLMASLMGLALWSTVDDSVHARVVAERIIGDLLGRRALPATSPRRRR